MAIKKSEVYSSLWKSCDELRALLNDHPLPNASSDTGK